MRSLIAKQLGCYVAVTVVVEECWKTANKDEYGREVGSGA
jgi:hypothetical protein